MQGQIAVGVHTPAQVGFVYDLEVLRRRKRQPKMRGRGRHKCLWTHRRTVARDRVHNLIPTEGLAHILNVVCDAGTQVATWYVAIFEANYTPVAGLTGAGFAAAATESTAYDEATRPAWDPTVTDGSVTNSASKAEFTINATKTIYGAALLSSAVKGGAGAQTILSAAQFSASRGVVATDILRVTCSMTLTSS